MEIKTTFAKALANLSDLLDRAANSGDVVIVKRRGSPDVAFIAADELAGLIETAHLLRSPRNAERLLSALRRTQGASLSKPLPHETET